MSAQSARAWSSSWLLTRGRQLRREMFIPPCPSEDNSLAGLPGPALAMLWAQPCYESSEDPTSVIWFHCSPQRCPFPTPSQGQTASLQAAQGTKPLLSETEQCPLSPCFVQFLVKLKGDEATKAMGHLTVPSQEVCGPHSGSCRPFSLQVLAFHGWSGPPISARNNSFHFKAFVCIPVSFTGIYAL